MIAKKELTPQQKVFTKINKCIEDDFNDLDSKLEIFSMLNLDDGDKANYGLFLHIRDIQDYLKAIEYKVLKGKF